MKILPFVENLLVATDHADIVANEDAATLRDPHSTRFSLRRGARKKAIP